MTSKNKNLAKLHLQQTWNTFQAFKSKHAIDLTEQVQSSPELASSSNDDDLEIMLKAHDKGHEKKQVCLCLLIYLFM